MLRQKLLSQFPARIEWNRDFRKLFSRGRSFIPTLDSALLQKLVGYVFSSPPLREPDLILPQVQSRIILLFFRAPLSIALSAAKRDASPDGEAGKRGTNAPDEASRQIRKSQFSPHPAKVIPLSAFQRRPGSQRRIGIFRAPLSCTLTTEYRT